MKSKALTRNVSDGKDIFDALVDEIERLEGELEDANREIEDLQNTIGMRDEQVSELNHEIRNRQ